MQQKARDVRELDAAHEVARLDLKLAQETLQIMQAKFDQGRATLRDIEQARLDESDRWVAFLDAEFRAAAGSIDAFAGHRPAREGVPVAQAPGKARLGMSCEIE